MEGTAIQIVKITSGDLQIKGVHSLAQLFPEVKGDDFRKLVKDIREHGLLEPIVLDGDVLIDGRQRLRACKEAGVKPRFVQFASLGLDVSLGDYIWSENVSRRHLTDDQRAALSTKWADADRKAAREIRLANLKRGERKPEVANPPHRGKTRTAIAKRANVSEHKIRQAETIHRRTPHLEDKVIAGEMKLKDAAAAVTPLTVRITTTTREFHPVGRPSKRNCCLGSVLRRQRGRDHAVLQLIELLNRVRLFDEDGTAISFEVKRHEILVWRGN